MEAQTILTTYVDFLFIDRPGSCRGEREREHNWDSRYYGATWVIQPGHFA